MKIHQCKITRLVLAVSLLLIFASCAKKEILIPIPEETSVNEGLETPVDPSVETPVLQVAETLINEPQEMVETPIDVPEETLMNEEITAEEKMPEPTPSKPVEQEQANKPAPVIQKPTGSKLIVIDAGHQSKGNSTKEANGPGSSTMKAKVSSGTKGVSTGLYEYELNLIITFKLQTELEKRGYTVVLVRDNHQVDISNIERAQVANDAGADAFIRIHANGADDQNVHGALTICQTSSNPYNASTYKESYRLSDHVLKKMVEATGAKDRGIWQTDTMTGINWSEVPSTIVEMGFMSNPKEDELMASDSYQEKIVQGISNGIDAYFNN